MQPVSHGWCRVRKAPKVDNVQVSQPQTWNDLMAMEFQGLVAREPRQGLSGEWDEAETYKSVGAASGPVDGA